MQVGLLTNSNSHKAFTKTSRKVRFCVDRRYSHSSRVVCLSLFPCFCSSRNVVAHSLSFCEFCAMGTANKQKLRVLCLHGFRTNSSIMERQLAKWDRSILDLLDLVFLDAPYTATGESDVDGLFPPPFFEWFQYEKTEIGAVNYKTLKECIRAGEVTYRNLKECIQFISDFMETQGPFDGLIGFSQGSILSAALAGMQQQGLALNSVPVLRFVIIISGGVLKGDHEFKGCYLEPIRCPSVHLIGDNDALKTRSEHLLLKFEDPVVVRTGAKHTVPRLDEKAALPIKAFLEDIVSDYSRDNNKTI